MCDENKSKEGEYIYQCTNTIKFMCISMYDVNIVHTIQYS